MRRPAGVGRHDAPILCDDNAVSAPRPHTLHRGPVTQPQCHVLHVVLHGSHEPSGSRSIDTLGSSSRAPAAYRCTSER
eukprot:4686960-Prymnesium_polylepis.1